MLAYSAALSKKSQAQAPVACPQIDRRALLQWSKALTHGYICTLICFFCAQKHVYIREERARDISFRSDLISEEPGLFHFTGLTESELEDHFGVATYKSRYSPTFQCADAQRHYEEELEKWTSDIVGALNEASVKIICCPEDVTCGTCDPKT